MLAGLAAADVSVIRRRARPLGLARQRRDWGEVAAERLLAAAVLPARRAALRCRRADPAGRAGRLEPRSPRRPRLKPSGRRSTRRERNAAYDNNAAVANSAALVEARNAGLGRLSQGPSGRPRHPLRAGRPRRRLIFIRRRDPAAPCLVFIHGGYWQRNSRELFAAYAEGIGARRLVGRDAAAIRSRRRRGSRQSCEEIGAALDWLADHGPAHGVAGPVVCSGWSAGAQLAALHLGHRRVAAGLAISGVYDLGPLRDTALNDALKLSDEEIATLVACCGCRRPRQSRSPSPTGRAELPALVRDLRAAPRAARGGARAGPLCCRSPARITSPFSKSCAALDGELVRAAQRLIEDVSN